MEQQFTFDDLQAIMRGRKHFEEFDFPGFPEIRIAIRVLSQRDIQDIARTTDVIVGRVKKENDEDLRNSVLYSKEIERQILSKAVVQIPMQDPETGDYVFSKFFNSADEVGKLDQSIINDLFEKYNIVQEKYSPQTRIQTEEDFEKLIEQIKKKSAIGLSLSTYALQMLVDFLVKNPEILLKDNGSSLQQSNSESQSLKKKPAKIQVEKIGSVNLEE